MANFSTNLGLWGVPLAIGAGAIRNSTPFLFVSLGETLTERSGRINLGQEGTLVMGAMAGFAMSYYTATWFPSAGPWLGPWIGVLCAGLAAAVLGAIHALLCSQPRVNDIAVGIGIMIFGVGLAFYLGKPFVPVSAPQLPAINFGFWSHIDQIRSAMTVNWLFFVGVALAPIMAWMLKNTRWGLIVRTAGESVDSARAMGYSVNRVRFFATVIGAFLAGVGGSFLSLYYPGSWNEGLSSGQGLMAVALVIFARWNPISCVFAALLFGGASALGPALQSIGVSKGHYLFSAAPYFVTLLIMIITCSSSRSLAGAPDELGKSMA
ncbi:MAG TPA: ABC transporter permease [Tepidisphaeraceae bacterium]|nr:ABC transporter permease [Tepidisphaeraceae bacterium]